MYAVCKKRRGERVALIAPVHSTVEMEGKRVRPVHEAARRESARIGFLGRCGSGHGWLTPFRATMISRAGFTAEIS
jgi:hypothetical protein